MQESPQTGEAPKAAFVLSPTWTSSAKDLVTTSLGSARLWATVGHGIVNEVYWPSTGEPQIRDLGFIVATPEGWHEVKRVCRYELTTPRPEVPLPLIVHAGPNGAYRLELEIVPDPARDVLLIRYALLGQGCRLYALLAPHLGPKSDANEVWSEGGALWGAGGGVALCLACDQGFARASAGYVGASDGWQDFAANGRMTWAYDRAGPGNVAVMGELAAGAGVLALGFSASCEGAGTLARSSLAAGFVAARAAFLAGWSDWSAGLALHADGRLTPELAAQARRSAAVIRAHEDRTFPGAVVASLSVPWGNSHDDLGGYHLVWARDAVNSGLGLLAIGQDEDARRMLAYLVAMQAPDGHWAQNFYPDGRPFWKGLQLDEVGFPVLLAAKLRDRGQLDLDGETALGVGRMVERALGFIARNGPITPQDRWEEDAGLNPYTLAVVVAALVAGAPWLDGGARTQALALADDWNARIEDWTYASGSRLAHAHGVAGHYVRIVPGSDRPIAEQEVEVRNLGGRTVRADELVALDFLGLSRFGLRAADDPKMQATLKVCEAELGVDTPMGRTYHRYAPDGYGEHADGAPFDGTGIGRGWPLLTGERGHFALQAGDDPLPYLDAMARMTGPGGMIPEQVWDASPIFDRGLEPGRPSGSAMPLVWAHSEFLRLAVATAMQGPVELLDAVVARYGFERPTPSLRHWQTSAPFAALPKDGTIRVLDVEPFTLHLSFDEWQTVLDQEAEAGPFGLWSATIEANERGGRDVVFTRRYAQDRWEGRDHRIAGTV